MMVIYFIFVLNVVNFARFLPMVYLVKLFLAINN